MADIHCKHCGRFLGSYQGEFQARLKCANCKQYDMYHLISLNEWHGAIVNVAKPIKDNPINRFERHGQ